jgi:hypothetical protein
MKKGCFSKPPDQKLVEAALRDNAAAGSPATNYKWKGIFPAVS